MKASSSTTCRGQDDIGLDFHTLRKTVCVDY